ncbi:uncharacterized protein TRIVIDRAFT_62161 [Trichoderma virens Gv29-8]|uniref:Uncharacterized protein n=1 Tax=Hypocrea virens (strain Gv29-8 / FGSC 10586) TaxID=413071 RepID=G9MJ17_HYPVG|nr:uncharacterized protein TRIVIDRAFT_62161 [Trichoderma virens Gv29-8]EHK25482.1 hypothetical protein TRIVIDRAFT_62161 [Trichoderma virens Gv29-8]UKZ48699.1 hypothetical protein TrVGV298_002927 [Trichoderma virens]
MSNVRSATSNLKLSYTNYHVAGANAGEIMQNKRPEKAISRRRGMKNAGYLATTPPHRQLSQERVNKCSINGSPPAQKCECDEKLNRRMSACGSHGNDAVVLDMF